MHNYANKLTCLAMMNKNCIFDSSSGKSRFWKNKGKTKLVVFKDDEVSLSDGMKQVSRMYLDADPLTKGSYHMEEIVSEIDCAEMFDGVGKDKKTLNGKKFIDMRGTVNKWSRMMKEGHLVAEQLSDDNIDEVLEMIEEWRHMENGGMKYMWQERAGCDKAFVKRIVEDFEDIRDHIIATVFKLDGKCVGYSTIPKHPTSFAADGVPEVTYLTRKVVNAPGRRNLTEFIDWHAFKMFHEANPSYLKFYVNWGASSDGVKWYKMHKFPLHDTETKWFLTIKADKKEEKKKH